MLGPRYVCFVGFQTGNWMPKINFGGKKNLTWQDRKNWQKQRIGALKKTILVGTNWCPDKN
jgi:hypothetical protein